MPWMMSTGHLVWPRCSALSQLCWTMLPSSAKVLFSTILATDGKPQNTMFEWKVKREAR